MKAPPPDHYCPGCGTPRAFSQRYPWHFCDTCLARSSDGEGRLLGFGNVSLSGGLRWFYRDDPETDDQGSRSVLCLIDGRDIVVSEARFGGVVAEPVNSATLSALAADRAVADLRGGPAMHRARESLRKSGAAGTPGQSNRPSGS